MAPLLSYYRLLPFKIFCIHLFLKIINQITIKYIYLYKGLYQFKIIEKTY
jgi:hypothetical protein